MQNTAAYANGDETGRAAEAGIGRPCAPNQPLRLGVAVTSAVVWAAMTISPSAAAAMQTAHPAPASHAAPTTTGNIHKSVGYLTHVAGQILYRRAQHTAARQPGVGAYSARFPLYPGDRVTIRTGRAVAFIGGVAVVLTPRSGVFVVPAARKAAAQTAHVAAAAPKPSGPNPGPILGAHPAGPPIVASPLPELASPLPVQTPAAIPAPPPPRSAVAIASTPGVNARPIVPNPEVSSVTAAFAPHSPLWFTATMNGELEATSLYDWKTPPAQIVIPENLVNIPFAASVTVRVIFSSAGQARSSIAHTSGYPALDHAAQDACQGIQLAPRKQNPAPADTTVDITFQVNNMPPPA